MKIVNRMPCGDGRPRPSGQETGGCFMKIVTAAEMREIDRATSERFGVHSLTLMENAGASVADFVLSHYSSARRIVVICGRGNNGGEGFVGARRLHHRGKHVYVVRLADP